MVLIPIEPRPIHKRAHGEYAFPILPEWLFLSIFVNSAFEEPCLRKDFLAHYPQKCADVNFFISAGLLIILKKRPIGHCEANVGMLPVHNLLLCQHLL